MTFAHAVLRRHLRDAPPAHSPSRSSPTSATTTHEAGHMILRPLPTSSTSSTTMSPPSSNPPRTGATNPAPLTRTCRALLTTRVNLASRALALSHCRTSTRYHRPMAADDPRSKGRKSISLPGRELPSSTSSTPSPSLTMDVCLRMDCTESFSYAKDHHLSIFLTLLHRSLRRRTYASKTSAPASSTASPVLYDLASDGGSCRRIARTGPSALLTIAIQADLQALRRRLLSA